ncbi:kinase-like protein [Ceratobasidium sp. AG-I]|nr:kinase-like protein [Ceratobasidium sp. AG-I]
MDNYEVDTKKALGEGSYGEVFKGKERGTGRIVALKRMKFNLMDEGLPGGAMREISNMRELKHDNIVRILNIVYADAGTLYLVMEHLEMDLRKYMALQFTRHLMKGIAYCHSHRILHRDLKPANLLIDAQQVLKIADFGLSRTHSIPSQAFSHEVSTLWYRAPELLLGELNYTSSFDMWSIGCIIAEMARAGQPMFMGTSEIDQLFKIFQVLGTPDEALWPGVSTLPDWKDSFPHWPTKNMLDTIPHIPESGLDLIMQCLFYPPLFRISARRALLHPWLNESIPAVFPECLMHHYVSNE